MANIIGFVGIGVTGVALLFAIIALAADKWQGSEPTTGSGSTSKTEFSKYGLWKGCKGGVICTDIVGSDDINTCKAMIFLAIFTSAGAIACVILLLLVMKDKQILLLAASGLDIAAGFFLMIAMAVYVDKVKIDKTDLDYGFTLDVIAWLAAWAAGGIFLSKYMSKDEN